MSSTITLTGRPGDEHVQMAACRLYDAECALHAARQSHIDPWIRSAGDKLHEAVVEYLATLPAEHRDAG